MTAGREREHGYARYRLDGCRCYVCAFARSQYDDNRNRAIAYGTWRPWAEAEPVRTHIRTLQDCGMGLRAIAATANVDRKRLQAIVTGRSERGTGPQEKVRPALAAAILSVEPTLDNLSSAAVIGAIGTARRLQGLVQAGWPQHHLAVRLGMTDGNFGTCLRRQQVTVRVARAVRALYAELEYTNPREHGVDLHAFNRAQNHAARNEWPPSIAWDDETIDDPEAFPEWTGACGTTQGHTIHKAKGIPYCPPCRSARAQYQRDLRAAQAAAAA